MVYLVLYPIAEAVFLVESTLRLWRAGFPLRAAFEYSLNR